MGKNAREIKFMKTDLKVLYILEIFPEISETFILDEILEVMRQGIEVEIVSLVKPKEVKYHKNYHALLSYTSYIKDIELPKKYLAAFVMLTRNPLRFFKFVKYLYRIEKYVRNTRNRLLEICYLCQYAKRRRIEHVHAHFANISTSYAMWIHMLTDLPYTFTTHGYDVFYVIAKDMYLKTKLAKVHITISDFNKNYLESKLNINSQKIKRIYCGIDADRFSYKSIYDRENIILNVGRLEKVKGQEYLIKACHILKNKGLNFKCLIVGEGKERSTLEKLIYELSLNDICFLEGSRAHEGVISYYKRSKLFVLSSISEGLPTVLKESLACGIPIVATNVRGIPEIIIDGKTGYLADSQSEQDIADKILLLWNDREAQERFSRNGRKLVEEKFVLSNQVKEIINIWYN